MLWYKAWLETRWRFLIGFLLLVCSAAMTVFSFPSMMKLRDLQPEAFGLGGAIGEQIREQLALSRSFDGYVWASWFGDSLLDGWALFAVMLGAGGLLTQASTGGALYTLSMPATRRRLLGVRAATALGELLVLAIVPSLLIPLLALAIGERYSVADTLVYSLCLFVVGSTLFSLTFLLSTVFADVWRPAMIAIALFAVVTLVEGLAVGAPTGLLGSMTAEPYFRTAQIPIVGLFGGALASAAMLYGATVNIARRDF